MYVLKLKNFKEKMKKKYLAWQELSHKFEPHNYYTKLYGYRLIINIISTVTWNHAFFHLHATRVTPTNQPIF